MPEALSEGNSNKLIHQQRMLSSIVSPEVLMASQGFSAHRLVSLSKNPLFSKSERIRNFVFQQAEGAPSSRHKVST
jgi:hypothetical protein